MRTKAQLASKLAALAGGSGGRPVMRLFLQEINSPDSVYYKSCYSTELKEDEDGFSNSPEMLDVCIKLHGGWPGFTESPAPEPVGGRVSHILST